MTKPCESSVVAGTAGLAALQQPVTGAKDKARFHNLCAEKVSPNLQRSSSGGKGLKFLLFSSWVSYPSFLLKTIQIIL